MVRGSAQHENLHRKALALGRLLNFHEIEEIVAKKTIKYPGQK